MQTMNLEWLLHPIDRQLFFDHYLEQQPLIIQRNDATYFERLLSLKDVDELLSKASHLGRIDVLLIHAQKKYQVTDYAVVQPFGNVEVKKSLNVKKALQLFSEDKATIIINLAINECQPLSQLATNYAREVNASPGANIFIAPSNATCFGAHFDEHDLFILQTHGSKHWKIYESPIILPSQPQNGRNFDFAGLKLLHEIDLHQGDTLYLPRGFVHDVTTTDSNSVHISFGGQHYTWGQMIKTVITQLAVKNESFRRGAVINDLKATDQTQHLLSLLKSELASILTAETLNAIAESKIKLIDKDISYI